LWPAPEATTNATNSDNRYTDLVSRIFIYISFGEGYLSFRLIRGTCATPI
jgi:hypothetical protein